MEFIGRKGELSKLHAEYSRDSSAALWLSMVAAELEKQP